MATMKSSKHEMLRSQWVELIKQQKDSRLSVRKWCQENDISSPRYYYWLKILFSKHNGLTFTTNSRY